MRQTISALLLAAAMAATAAAGLPARQGRNLFHDYLGKSGSEIDAKLSGAWNQIRSGDEQTQRLIISVPGGMAYVPDVANRDVRTEGLSYAMMIAVQLDHQEAFDQVWRFAKAHLYHSDGPFRGYFAWHCTYAGVPLDPGPASDGEEWFTTALFFASHRWGDGSGILDYGGQAQEILHTMLHAGEEGRPGVTGMFDRDAHQVVFVPQGKGATFTDPSYHLPAFYELWARWAAAPADRAFLAEATRTSRAFFHRAADPRTGLMPDYARFSGAPVPQNGHGDFRYDAWRTLSNPALDYAWWGADRWEVEQANRVLDFFAAQGPDCPDRFKLDGTPVSSNRSSPGLVAMEGAAALAADEAHGRPAVERLWNLPMPQGQGRYYGGLLTILAWLEVSGRFRIYAPK